MAMLQFASDMFRSSIAEAQKCFAAPIDHTRHNVQAPNEIADSRRVREQAPPPVRSVEHAKDSAASRSECSSSQAPGQSQLGGWTDISLGPTRPNGCATSDSAHSSTTASLSVVVVGKDGSKISSTHDLSAYSESGHAQNLSLAPAEREQCPNITSTSVQEADERRSWQTGSIVEVYSSSGRCWHAALVMQVKKELDVDQDMLTLQFWLDIDDAKRKILCRSDANLQPLGTHCQGQLPVGFQEKPSRSRPGQSVYVDATTGLRYESIELAWAAHFKRWLEYRMPVGSQTIRTVNAVVDTVAPSTQQEAPQENDLDAQAPEGLVTEFAMSREHRVASTSETPLTNTNASGCEERACIGLVTEYESDWNTVRQGGSAEKASARSLASETQSQTELGPKGPILGTLDDQALIPSASGIEAPKELEQNGIGDQDVWVASPLASETEASQQLEPQGPQAGDFDVEAWRPVASEMEVQHELEHDPSIGTADVQVSRPLASEVEAPQEVEPPNVDEVGAKVSRPLASETEAEVQHEVEQSEPNTGAVDVQASTPVQQEVEQSEPNTSALDDQALPPLQQEVEQSEPNIGTLDVHVPSPLAAELEAPEELDIKDSSTGALDAVQALSRSAPNASSAMVSCAADQDERMQRVTPIGLVTVA